MLKQPAPEPLILLDPDLNLLSDPDNPGMITLYTEPHTRLECLKLALQVASETRHFDRDYKDSELFFAHLEQVYEIADRNLKYVTGES